MKNFLHKLGSWYFPLIFLGITVLFFTLFFNKYHAQLNEIAGKEFKTLDTRFLYTSDEVIKDFELIGEEGRAIHRYLSSVVDMFFPLAHGLLVISIFSFLLQKLNLFKKGYLWVFIIPLVIVVLDVFENFNTIKFIDNFPDLTETSVANASRITSFKHIFSILSIGATVLMLCGLAFNAVINNFNKSK